MLGTVSSLFPYQVYSNSCIFHMDVGQQGCFTEADALGLTERHQTNQLSSWKIQIFVPKIQTYRVRLGHICPALIR